VGDTYDEGRELGDEDKNLMQQKEKDSGEEWGGGRARKEGVKKSGMQAVKIVREKEQRRTKGGKRRERRGKLGRRKGRWKEHRREQLGGEEKQLWSRVISG